MSKIFKNMIPYWKIVIAIIGLLVVQAWCDLSLPSYTSDIIDVGIQNHGVEHVMPEKIQEEEFQTAQFIMTDQEKRIWNDIYVKKGDTKVLKNLSQDRLEELDKQLALPLIMNYQMSAMEEKTFEKMVASQMASGSKNNGSQNDATSQGGKDAGSQNGNSAKVGRSSKNQSGLSVDQIEKFMGVKLHRFRQKKEDSDGNSKMVQCVDVRPVFIAMQKNGMLDEKTLFSTRDSMKNTIDTMGSSLVKTTGIAYAIACDKAAGVDVDKIQKTYLVYAGLKMVGMALLMGVVTVLVGFFASKVAAGIGMTLRENVFKKVVGFSNAEFDKFSTASLITRSTNDIQQIQMLAVMLLRMVMYAPIMAIGGIFKVLHTNVSMSWIIVLGVILIVMVVAVLFIVAIPKFKILQNLVDRLNLVTREILTGLPVIRAFSTEKHEEERFDKANRDLTRTNLFVNRAMTFMMPMMMLIMNGITILIVWSGAHGVSDGQMQVGDMMAFIQYTMQIIMSFLMICMISIMLPRAAVAADRVDEILTSRTAIEDPKTPEKLEESRKGEVKFDHVSFRYPGAEEDVLHDISFTAKPGQTTAIIGSTGSGKSTMINLIPRFYDVTEGTITLDGKDIRTISQHDLRDELGYVPQKGVLFSGTIESNILYGNPDGSEAEMKEAAEIAQATEFIEEKHKKYESPIAQGGSNVSGGQKQRLSIARAIAKKPKVYIFDDSFSALDYKTDVTLRAALKEKTQDSTVIIVAQRISTILHAEQIIVLDDGKIAGIGTHKELLKSCDAYYQIASSQLSEAELARDLNNENDGKEEA